MKALIVEDVPEVAKTLTMWLATRWPETTVVAAASGTDVVAMVASEVPDLVILDLGPPGEDGLDVLREIRTHGPRRRVEPARPGGI